MSRAPLVRLTRTRVCGFPPSWQLYRDTVHTPCNSPIKSAVRWVSAHPALCSRHHDQRRPFPPPHTGRCALQHPDTRALPLRPAAPFRVPGEPARRSPRVRPRSTQHFASDPSRIRVSPRLVQAAARTHTSFRLLTESWWLSNNLWFFFLSVSGCFPFFRIPKFFSWMKQPGEDVSALCVVVLNEASLLRGRTLYSRVPPLKVPFPRH